MKLRDYQLRTSVSTAYVARHMALSTEGVLDLEGTEIRKLEVGALLEYLEACGLTLEVASVDANGQRTVLS